MIEHPMPCPGCRKMIDAAERLCPHCGVDTDAKLAPFGAALIVAIGLLVLGLLWLAAVPVWLLGLGAGAIAGGAVAWLRHVR